ncbi:neurolin-b precursor [Takifugu rubripes]|uniref:Neurolin-b n=1 Tax=Takifugu rubripes TaxID=31033 RepID=A0S0K8_TAKRU|nr:neurolin-b precursor [Takifugu rubripes]ABC50097.1 neurolin-b [Takifugu rubripes]|eukprot:NP_001092127.1 neurolin-b precursor [Takifugu rubripes]
MPGSNQCRKFNRRERAGGILLLLKALLFVTASSLETINGLYGGTLVIPCNTGAIKAEDILITKWKYDKGDGLAGDLLVKQRDQNTSIIANDEYKGRVSMAANFSLLLSDARLTDQRTFTCMVVAGANIVEYPVNIVVYKTPTELKISDKAEELEIGKPTKLATCVAAEANPAANITWLKNNTPLVADGDGTSIHASVLVDPITGLSTTSSVLEYSAKKEDTNAEFTCRTVEDDLVSQPVTFTITYSTENVVLQVTAVDPLVEGDNLTLKCVADGNPAPTSFNFHLKGEVVKVENANTYTITNVTRDTSGEYKCSLVDNPTMEASEEVVVKYLDVILSPSGTVVKNAGETLDLGLHIDSSEATKVSWTKDNFKLNKEPKFTKVAYSDAGRYECDVTMGLLNQKASFELVVEGAPVIRQLSKQRGDDGQHKVLVCEAEGSPKPSVSWSINGTSLDESPFINGKITHRIKVVPTANLTVSCTVSNDFGMDTRTINVSSLFEDVRVAKQGQTDGDQTRLVVGVVVGLLVAAVVLGLAYWVYMKKSKQGSWKTGEKENGSSEEEKKLEEKVEENSQKAEV